MRLSTGFQKQAWILAGACALALLVVAAVAYNNMVRLSYLLQQNTEISAVLRNHQFADMMHDTMRAQVYRAMWEARSHPQGMAGIQKETEDYIAQFQAAIDSNAGKNLDRATHLAIEQARVPLKQYIQKTRNIVALVARDPAAAEALFQDFQTTFALLEGELAKITDLLEAQVQQNEAAGQQAQAKAVRDIGLTLLLAVIFVLSVLLNAGSRLARTLNLLSARLRDHDSDISAELEAPDHREIGALIRAFNAHNLNLRNNEERWKFALEGAGDAAWDWDALSETVEFSPRWRQMLGYTENDKPTRMLESEWLADLHPGDKDHVVNQLRTCQTGATDSYVAQYRYRGKDGNWKWIQARGMVLRRNPEGKWTRMLGTCSDISERKSLEARIHALAYFDVTTGLANRSLFSDRVQQALTVAQRESTKLALMFIDLDKFKEVNDRFGHSVGDLLLAQVAQRLQQCIRESDTAGRIGGDEFVVLLRPVQATACVLQVAEKMLTALRASFDLDGHVVRVSASIGVALYPEHGLDEEDLIKSTDTAMYLAKNKGRDNIQVAASGSR